MPEVVKGLGTHREVSLGQGSWKEQNVDEETHHNFSKKTKTSTKEVWWVLMLTMEVLGWVLLP